MSEDLAMLQEMRRALELSGALPEQEWGFFANNLREIEVVRNGVLLEEGSESVPLFFIGKGLVRLHTSEGGYETTLGFDWEGRFTTDYAAFCTRGLARFGLQALEATAALAIPRDLFEDCLARHHVWERTARKQLEFTLSRKIDKELRIRSLPPAARYEKLVREQSPLLDRVPQYHLAAYLGITPETLSRIRSRMK